MKKVHAVALVVAAFALVLLAAAFYPVLSQKNNSQSLGNTTNAIFIPFVKGCATEGEMAKEREGKRGEASGEETAAAVSVNGNTVSYSHAATHYCCLTVNVSGEIGAGKITIAEKWGGSPCRCMCFSELGANFLEVPHGNYLVEVYRVDLEERKLLLAENISIG